MAAISRKPLRRSRREQFSNCVQHRVRRAVPCSIPCSIPCLKLTAGKGVRQSPRASTTSRNRTDTVKTSFPCSFACPPSSPAASSAFLRPRLSNPCSWPKARPLSKPAPVLISPTPFRVVADINLNVSDSVSSALVQPPTGALVTFSNEVDSLHIHSEFTSRQFFCATFFTSTNIWEQPRSVLDPVNQIPGAARSSRDCGGVRCRR